MESSGQRIRNRREELGLSQADLARESGVTVDTIDGLEHDVLLHASIDTYYKVACALKLTIFDIVPKEAHEMLPPIALAFSQFCKDLDKVLKQMNKNEDK